VVLLVELAERQLFRAPHRRAKLDGNIDEPRAMEPFKTGWLDEEHSRGRAFVGALSTIL
jgi:hypothetical protein